MGKISTVRDFINARMGFSVWCRDCEHSALLDLHKLPPDLDLYVRPLPFVCSKCRSRNVAPIIHGRDTVTGRK